MHRSGDDKSDDARPITGLPSARRFPIQLENGLDLGRFNDVVTFLPIVDRILPIPSLVTARNLLEFLEPRTSNRSAKLAESNLAEVGGFAGAAVCRAAGQIKSLRGGILIAIRPAATRPHTPRASVQSVQIWIEPPSLYHLSGRFLAFVVRRN